jgi:hypothetical protein
MVNELGNRYEKLLVIGEVRRGKRNTVVWLCRCDCGVEKILKGSELRSGKIRSCGCMNKHYCSGHPLYRTWSGMVERCSNPNSPSYENYGLRGIEIHPAWREDPRPFIQWIEENLGPRPEGMTLDRISVNGNYEPGNLRWANAKQQSWNRRAANQVHPELYKLLTEPIEFVYCEGGETS